MNGKKHVDKWMNKGTFGFTLVELIVVLVILSVLSAVAVPTVLGYIDDSKAKECRTQVEALTAEVSSAKMAAEVNGEEGGVVFDVQAYINAAGDSGECPVDGNTYQYIKAENKIVCPNKHGEGIISGSGKFTVAVAEDTGKRESPDAVQKYKAQIQVESGSTNMKPDEHTGLHVTVTDEHGNPVPDENVTVTWTFPNDGSVQGTSNGTKATLDAKKAGGGQVSCTVTVTKEDGTKETVPCGPVNVTVTDPQPEYNAKIVVESGSPNNMNPGEHTELHVTVTDKEGKPVPEERVHVTWTFPTDGSVDGKSNGTSATVDALGKGGGQVSCTVTVEEEDGTKTTVPCGPVDVTVNEKEPELHLEVGSLEVSAGEDGNLNARAVDEKGGNYSGEVKYSYEVTPQEGSDKGITVDENGNVHGVTPGTYHVTVTVTDKNDPNKKESKTVDVTVKEAPDTQHELSLEVPSDLTVREGEDNTELPDGVQVFDENGQPYSDVEITYSSSDEKKATVDPVTGKVHGVEAGECEITVTVKDKKTNKSVSKNVKVNVMEKESEGGLFNPHTFQFWTTDAASVKLQNDEVFKRILDNLPPGTWSLVSGEIDSAPFFGNGEVNLFPKHYMDGDEQSCATDFVLKYVTYDGREDEITVKIGYPINYFTNILDKGDNASEAIFGIESDPMYTSDVPFTWEVEPKPDSATVEWEYANERHTKIKVKKSPDGQCKFRVRVHTTRQKTGEEVWSEWREITIDKKKEIANVTLSPSPLTLKEGEIATLTATPEYNNINVDVSKVTYNFSSWNTSQIDGNVIEVQPSDNTVTVKGLKAGNAVIQVNVSYNYNYMTSAQCQVTVIEAQTETETEAEALPPNEVEIDGKHFGAMSWEEFKKEVEELNGKNFKANNGRDDPTKEDKAVVLFYDEEDVNGVKKRTLYVAQGNSANFSTEITPVTGSNSFKDFLATEKGQGRLSVVDLDHIVDIAEEDLASAPNIDGGYSYGTVVRVKKTTGEYEYYIAYDATNNTKTQLNKVGRTKAEGSGWWKLKPLS